MNTSNTLNLTTLTAAALLLIGLTVTASISAQSDAEPLEQKIPVKQSVTTTCAGDVDLKGEILGQFRVKPDGAGGSKVEADFGYEGLAVTVLKNKDAYRAAGSSHFDSTGQLPMGFDYVANFALNKPGTEESMMGHVKLRIDLKTKDEVIAVVKSVEIDCRK